MSCRRVMRRVLVVSVVVREIFTPRVDFILTPSASLVPLMQGDNIGLLCFCGFVESWLPLLFSPCFRGSPAGEGVKFVLCNLYSVISMVSVETGMGMRCCSMRSVWVVATGRLEAHDISNAQFTMQNAQFMIRFSFIVFFLEMKTGEHDFYF